MTDAMNIALSGLLAQGRKLSATANNIANISTSGRIPTENNPDSNLYKRLDVKFTSNTIAGEGAGVKTEIYQRDNYVPIFDPSSPDANEEGFYAAPAINLETELVNMMTAKLAYKANVKTIQAQREMMGELLDSIT